mmetsp:Transcript_6282/g.18913  ORF Transcript_6282/g.18913 Transcript_6282/m.18913 type:complete len:200 (+) Transcript_6282:351-950(+)
MRSSSGTLPASPGVVRPAGGSGASASARARCFSALEMLRRCLCEASSMALWTTSTSPEDAALPGPDPGSSAAMPSTSVALLRLARRRRACAPPEAPLQRRDSAASLASFAFVAARSSSWSSAAPWPEGSAPPAGGVARPGVMRSAKLSASMGAWACHDARSWLRRSSRARASASWMASRSSRKSAPRRSASATRAGSKL